jgi:hypothetical protein
MYAQGICGLESAVYIGFLTSRPGSDFRIECRADDGMPLEAAQIKGGSNPACSSGPRTESRARLQSAVHQAFTIDELRQYDEAAQAIIGHDEVIRQLPVSQPLRHWTARSSG